MFTKGEVKNLIFQRLNKSPATPGFYTQEKVSSAIQEALDFVAAEMFIADQGFMKKLDYLDVEANQITIPVPPHMEIIDEVRYLVGSVYIPLAYDSQWATPQWSPTTGATDLPGSYRIVDNRFYFAPPLATGGTAALQIEYQRYPSILRNDAQQIDPQFSRAMIWFAVYRACSILASAMKQETKPWRVEEKIWYDKMLQIVNQRNAQSIPIREFQG